MVSDLTIVILRSLVVITAASYMGWVLGQLLYALLVWWLSGLDLRIQ